MKLRCRLSNRRMIEYLDETMSASARKRFDLHLASCEDCRDKLAEQKIGWRNVLLYWLTKRKMGCCPMICPPRLWLPWVRQPRQSRPSSDQNHLCEGFGWSRWALWQLWRCSSRFGRFFLSLQSNSLFIPKNRSGILHHPWSRHIRF